MAPKGRPDKDKEKLIAQDEDVLQAVILAESFNNRFRPLTSRKPRCLLPICNAPLLDWTFESLALAGVQEIFVICRSHAEKIRAAIGDSKWSKPGSGLKITPILSSKDTLLSAGDAMRDIYGRGLLRSSTSDFIFVHGDLVSNVRIDEVVRVHRERRKENKDAIMTIVVKESGLSHRTRTRGESSIFVLDAATDECLHYEPVRGYPPPTTIEIPREALEKHSDIEIRNDLIDCCIDICSIEVPSLFQDNFDYSDIRNDFVHGVLTSDLLMKNIYCYVAKEGYAARVKDTRSYAAVSKDILSRWTFPLVPDDNHPGGQDYEHIRGNKYFPKDNSVTLARTSKVGNNTLVGSNTQVCDNAQVLSSVLGSHCVIGAGSVIQNSYLFDDVHVGVNCVIEDSIVGSHVSLEDNTRIRKGCLIGDNVIVGPNAEVPAFSKLHPKKRGGGDLDESDDGTYSGDDEDDTDGMDYDQAALGSLGEASNAFFWQSDDSDDDGEEEESMENARNQRFLRIGDTLSDLDMSDYGSDSSSLGSSDEDDDDFDGDSLTGGKKSLFLSSSSPNSSVLLEGTKSAEAAAEAEFRTEVQLSLERAFREGHSVDNAAVELKTLRMASNVPLGRVRESVVEALVNLIPLSAESDVQRREVAKVIGRWGQLLRAIGGFDAAETLLDLQMTCARLKQVTIFGLILAALYQTDILDEDEIRKWHRTPDAKGGEHGELEGHRKRCWLVGSRMLEQFDAQDSEDEEEEDDDDGDGDEGDDDDDTGEEEEEEEAKPNVSTQDAKMGEWKAPAEKEEPSSRTHNPSMKKPEVPPAPESSEDDDDDDDDDDDEEEESSEEEKPTKGALSVVTKEESTVPTRSSGNPGYPAQPEPPKGPVKAAEKPSAPHVAESSEDDDEDSEEEEEEESEEEKVATAPNTTAAKTVKPTPPVNSQQVERAGQAPPTSSQRTINPKAEDSTDEDDDDNDSEE